MRLFLDTNILIDIIEDRVEFAEDSTAVLILAEQMGASLSIAWHGLATAYYIIRRGRTEDAAMAEVDKILVWAEVAPVDSFSASRARSLQLPDFEDSMQCVCAENCLADFIITRNVRDFGSSPVPAISPKDFVVRFASP
jgi:hypothetical protein